MNRHRFRYYDLLVHAFVVILLISNLVGQKITAVGPFRISGAQLFFPSRISSATCLRRFMDMALPAAPSGSASSRRPCWR
jgi:hypothetical protein